MFYMTPQEIVSKFGKFRGVLHVGAHEAQERNDYIAADFRKRCWVEANPQVCERLLRSIAGPDDLIYNAIVSETDGEETKFHVASNGQSSSILPLKVHAEIYRDIVYTGYYSGKSTSLRTILESIPESETYDFINLDIQGVELRAIKGLGDRLSQFRAVYAEVNTLEMYEKCDMMADMDLFLESKGFTKIGYKLWGNDGWGDALYVRET